MLISLIIGLVIIGVALWAINAFPWIDAGIKRVISIIVIVAAVLWALAMLFPGHMPNWR